MVQEEWNTWGCTSSSASPQQPVTDYFPITAQHGVLYSLYSILDRIKMTAGLNMRAEHIKATPQKKGVIRRRFENKRAVQGKDKEKEVWGNEVRGDEKVSVRDRVRVVYSGSGKAWRLYRKQACGLGVWGIIRSPGVRWAEEENKGGQRLEKRRDGGGWK